MGRIIFATGLVGIGSITWIGYRMAEQRMIDVCGWSPMLRSQDCVFRIESQRDAVVTAGLWVALAFILVSLILYSRTRLPTGRFEGFSFRRSANPAAHPLPRP